MWRAIRHRLAVLAFALGMLALPWATAQALPSDTAELTRFISLLLRENSQLNSDKQKLLSTMISSIEAEYKRKYLESTVNIELSVGDKDTSVIYGSPIRVTARVHNKSDIPVYLFRDTVTLSIPGRIEDAGQSSRQRNAHPSNMGTDANPAVVMVSPKATFEIVWDQPRINVWDRLAAHLDAVDFRPDDYNFSVNVPLYYPPEHLDQIAAQAFGGVQSAVQPGQSTSGKGKPAPSSAAASVLVASTNPQPPILNAQSIQTKPYIIRSASKTVFVDLSPLFLALSAIPGGLMAVTVRWLFRAVGVGAALSTSYPLMARKERRRLCIEAILFMVTAIFIPFIAVAAAKATHNVNWGIAIRVYDFLGSVFLGFTIQLVAMKYGEPFLDKVIQARND